MYGFAPVGLLSLISAVRIELGLEPALLDLNRRVVDSTIEVGPNFYSDAASWIASSTPDVVGFMTECDSYHHVLQVAERVAAMHPRCRIVLGGPHASVVARPTLERYRAIDAVVQGEGERSFPRLLRDYIQNQFAPISGVLRRSQRDDLLDGGPASLIEDLDQLPIPAYERYFADPGEEVFVEVGRGCPFKCTFCSTAPYWMRRHRVKSPERILSEIMLVRSLFDTDRVHFTHDLFTTDQKWVRRLCAALFDAGRPVRWTCSARADLVDDDLLSVMANSGCDAIYFGIESGSDRVLRDIGKQIPIEHSLGILATCRRHGIKPNAGFILGFPSDALDSAADTFNAYSRAIEIGCRPTHIFGLCPFAGSSLFASLGTTVTNGHFLDLPLGRELEARNRGLIASNPNLFSAYYRPDSCRLREIEEGFVEGIDEFSPLVDAAALPALVLAQCLGGMLTLYRNWLRWIGAYNVDRGEPEWRRWYGSPTDFCKFLALSLEAQPSAMPGAADLARVLAIDHSFTSRRAGPSTIATYRSIRNSDTCRQIHLGSSIAVDNVVEAIAVNHNIESGLTWQVGDPLPKFETRRTHLLWHETGAHEVELVSVSPVIFRIVDDVRQRPRTVAEVVAKWSSDPETRDWVTDFDRVFENVEEAISSGLVRSH
jgi:hypothetical protein